MRLGVQKHNLSEKGVPKISFEPRLGSYIIVSQIISFQVPPVAWLGGGVKRKLKMRLTRLEVVFLQRTKLVYRGCFENAWSRMCTISYLTGPRDNYNNLHFWKSLLYFTCYISHFVDLKMSHNGTGNVLTASLFPGFFMVVNTNLTFNHVNGSALWFRFMQSVNKHIS